MTDNLLDVLAWEAAAYVWLFDAKSPEKRAIAWSRAMTAYPNVTTETAEEFWQRIQTTRWYKLNRHHYRHHHRGYADSWSDDYYDLGNYIEEYDTQVFSEYDCQDDGVYSSAETFTETETSTTTAPTGDIFRSQLESSDETDVTESEGRTIEHHHTESDSMETENEPLVAPPSLPKPKKAKKPRKRK
jgi:hypothetical protein